MQKGFLAVISAPKLFAPMLLLFAPRLLLFAPRLSLFVPLLAASLLIAPALLVSPALAAPGAEAGPAAAEPAPPQPPPAPEERARIEAALPAKAVVAPAKPRALLIFDRNVGYPGHRSIAHANLAFELLGRKTGAFAATVSRDPEVFRPASLRRFDAVFLNNNVGNLFTDPELRRSLLDFVYAGGGLMGVHGTTVAFTRWPGAVEDWPEFGLMLGGRGARHRASDELVRVKVDSPDHPLVRPFGGKPFEYRDEFFRVGDPYSRDRVRVLFSIDTERTDLSSPDGRWQAERADGDYALSWVRSHGRGRVFYSTIAHNPSVFSDPLMLEFYLGAIQFVLGDLPAPTTPSAKLTPAVRAREKLGWRLGVAGWSFHKFTLFEGIEKTAELGLSYFGALSFVKVSEEIPKGLDESLTDDEIAAVRRKLDAEGVRILTYYYHRLPAEEAACRKVFELGRKLGIETFISEPLPDAMDTIEKLCDEYGIDCAIHNHDEKASPHSWHPEKVLELAKGRSRRIGACVDMGYWMRSGIDPIEGIRILGDRVTTIEMHDLDKRGPDGHDVPWGTGAGETGRFLEEVHRMGLRPAMLGLEYSHDFLESMPEMRRCVEFCDEASIRLAR